MNTARRRTDTRQGSGQRSASREPLPPTPTDSRPKPAARGAPPAAKARPSSPPPNQSGSRRRNATPPEPEAPEVEPELEHDETPGAAHDPELEQAIFQLVTAVSQDDGRTYSPKMLVEVDAAKRRGFIRETGLRLYLTDHGRLWLNRAEPPPNARVYEMTKIRANERFLLKELARETRVPMQEAIGYIIAAVYDHRDALTRVARQHGEAYPWEAINWLVKPPKR